VASQQDRQFGYFSGYMAVTHSFAIGRDESFQQIEKLTKSHSLHSSESLCRLLRYLAEHTLDHPGVALKEYQIATEVLGRPPGFDPQSDSTVRVQAGRLRVKLAEYYSHEGVNDPILVEIPKGSYVLAFQFRGKPGNVVMEAPRIELPPRKTEVQPSNRRWAIAVAVLLVLLAVSVATSGFLLSRERTQPVAAQAVPAAYRLFWDRFLYGPQEPLVVFSNGSFVGRPETGMRYFNPASDTRAFILDHYTGVGEVLAIHQLDRVFFLLNRQLRVKRGALFTLDDAKNNDLIFVGSPSENLTLLDIPGTREFIFKRLDSGPRNGDLAVRNVHPQLGEPENFLATPANQPTVEDYAVVALLPGLDPARSVLILAGNSTFGTQAAVEFVCREDSIKELLQRLNVSIAAELKPFEALLRVKIAHGVPVVEELVAIRSRSN
jgi:hypothetical protein